VIITIKIPKKLISKILFLFSCDFVGFVANNIHKKVTMFPLHQAGFFSAGGGAEPETHQFSKKKVIE